MKSFDISHLHVTVILIFLFSFEKLVNYIKYTFLWLVIHATKIFPNDTNVQLKEYFFMRNTPELGDFHLTNKNFA